MKRILVFLIALCSIGLLCAVQGWAQQPGMRMYDPSTVETVQGAVERIILNPMTRGPAGYGVHLMLRTDQESVEVHLGPAWYLDNQETQIEEGDALTVTGSRITVNNQPALIAADVHKGDQVLVLRDEAGLPVWRGWRSGGGPGRGTMQGMGRGRMQGNRMQDGSGGWGGGMAYNRMYDPSSVETLQGTIAEVTYFTPRSGMAQGVHVMLEADGTTIPVHLGPAWYLDNQDVPLQVGDTIEVTGSRITFDGDSALIAAEVKKEGQVLRLRDENGFPRWSGWQSGR